MTHLFGDESLMRNPMKICVNLRNLRIKLRNPGSTDPATLGNNKTHTIDLTGGNPFQPKDQALIPQKAEPNTMEDEALTQSCNYSADKNWYACSQCMASILLKS
jgi:hypothetical protein